MTYEEWKKQGEPYAAGVALLASLAPGHVLLKTLRTGESALNKMYLKGSLVKLAAALSLPEANSNVTTGSVTPQVASGHDKKAPTPVPEAVPKTYLQPSIPSDLESRLRLLMSERTKLRNSYHDFSLRNDVPAVQARVKINRQLMDIRKEIEEVSRKIEVGGLTVGGWQSEPGMVTIPEGKEDYRELTNLYSNVSRQKSKLRKAIENKLPKEEIAAIELLLKQYETRRDLVAKKLKGK